MAYPSKVTCGVAVGEASKAVAGILAQLLEVALLESVGIGPVVVLTG